MFNDFVVNITVSLCTKQSMWILEYEEIVHNNKIPPKLWSAIYVYEVEYTLSAS